MAERARAVLHPALEPQHDFVVRDQVGGGGRDVRRFAHRQSRMCERGAHVRVVEGGAKAKIVGERLQRLARFHRGTERRPERQPAVAHVRKHEDVLDLSRSRTSRVALMFEATPPANATCGAPVRATAASARSTSRARRHAAP